MKVNAGLSEAIEAEMGLFLSDSLARELHGNVMRILRAQTCLDAASSLEAHDAPSLPVIAAGMMTLLKEECEKQHDRAEKAEAQLAAQDDPPQRELRTDDRGELDDVVIDNVKLFRLERMDTDRWWMRLYMRDGDDYVFDITTSGRKITITVETEKADT